MTVLPSSDRGGPYGPYYVVAMGKFTLLFLATFGIYRYYWLYKNWSLEQKRTGEMLLPWLRTIFYPVFIFDLFRRISNEEKKTGQHYTWSANFLSLLFLTSFLIKVWLNVLIANKSIDVGWSVLSFPFFFIEYYIFYKVQLVANRLSGDPFGKVNSAIYPINKVAIIFGFTLWYINLYGLYMLFFGGISIDTL